MSDASDIIPDSVFAGSAAASAQAAPSDDIIPPSVFSSPENAGAAKTAKREVTPFTTQMYHGLEDTAGGFAHLAGNLADIATGTNPKGGYAERWSAPFQHEEDYVGEPDVKEQVRAGLPKIDPYNAIPAGPLQDTMRERVPQFTEGVSTVVPGIAGVGVRLASAAEARAAAAIEDSHPLSAAAKSEASDMQTHATAAEQAGVTLPPREVSPAQAYVNDAARRDLNLPKNAPVTDGMLDAAKKQNVSPAYEAVKKTPAYELGPQYQEAIGKVDTAQIDPKWRPPTDGTMTGARAVELSGQLRSVARGMYDDAENMNLTYAQRQAAREQAQAHYQAAKAVEGGFREGATAADAAKSAATGVQTNAGATLADNWDKARVYNAKTEAWRGALDGAGNVSGPKIKKLLNDEPVSGPMKEVGSVVAQYPELFRSTRLQTPQPGIIKRGAAAAAPMVGAGVGGFVGGPGGAMVGEHVGRVVGGKIVGGP